MIGRMRQADAVLLINAQYKTGTVGSLCQAGSAPHIQAKHRAEELVTTIATVTTDSLKVRAEANTDSEVITMVPNVAYWHKSTLTSDTPCPYKSSVIVIAVFNRASTCT